MADSLFKKLPDIWKDLDLRVNSVINNQGLLERFLKVPDASVDRLEGFIVELLRAHNVQKIRDSFLPFLSPLVGHNWRGDRSRQHNRNKIQTSITRHSYKGTMVAISDIARECGSAINYIQDNASKLLILGKQGRLGYDDAYLVSSDYWHDGAFAAHFVSTGDTEELINELPSYIPAGEVWFIEFAHVSLAEFIADATIEFLGTLTFTNAQEGAIGFGILGQSLILSAQPSNDSDKTYLTSVWGDLFSKPIGSVGYGILGDNLFVSTQPGIASERSFNEIGWHISVPSGTLGCSLLGSELFLSVEPSFSTIHELDDYIPTPVSIGPIVLEMSEYAIEIDLLGMGSTHFLLSDDITLDEENR